MYASNGDPVGAFGQIHPAPDAHHVTPLLAFANFPLFLL